MKLHIPGIKLILVTIMAVVSIIFMTFLYGITYKQINSTLSTSGKIMHINHIELELEKLISRLLYAESTQRGIILSQDSSSWKSFNKSKLEIASSFSLLYDYLSTDSVQIKQLQLLDRTVNQRLDLLVVNLINPDQQLPYSQKRSKNLEDGNSLMESALKIKTEMLNYQDDNLKAIEQEHIESIIVTPIIYIAIVLVLLIIFTFLFLRLNADRKNLIKINDELTITNQSFAQAEKLAGLGNWRYNFQDNSSIYSDNFYSLLGLNPKEISLNLRYFLRMVHFDDRPEVIDAFKNSFRHYKPFIVTYRLHTKDNHLKHVKSIGKIITDNKNQKYFIGINMDITELVTSNRQLEIKNKKLELFNADLASFNYVASHDLQAPLRKIQMFISRINEMELDNLSAHGKEYFGRINSSAAHMQLLINDLLLFSRTNASNNKFELTNLNELLANALEELTMQIEEKNANIIPDTLPDIFAIPYQVQQLFINLLSNSLKFSKENVSPEIKISCKVVNKQAVVSEEDLTSDTYYKLAFCDNGIGFENQYSEKIFHLLFRLHDKSQYPGSGIGLAICKKIIENHFGFIDAESEPLKGSCFNVYFPTNLA